MKILTLSFDDGFEKSFIKISEIHEKFGLSACLNIIAFGHHKEFSCAFPPVMNSKRGDFHLWNELQDRGHEIMPHGLMHRIKSELPFQDACDYIQCCLDVFSHQLKGFNKDKAVFNFPGNSSTPELERWISTQCRAFRTWDRSFDHKGVNPMPSNDLTKLNTIGFGPGNCEEHLDSHLNEFLKLEEGWFIYNLHGLDEEGWGPIRETYLEKLLEKLVSRNDLLILPTAKALNTPIPL